MAALIGIDIGTTSVKAVLVREDGTRVDRFGADYPTERPGAGLAEQDPTHWTRLTNAALARFAAHPVAADVRGIGFTGQVNTHVFAGADGTPLAPAILWQDLRAAKAGAALDASISPDDKLAWLGAPIPVDASHALARMAWMAAERPEVWGAARAVLAPKDHVIAALTGRIGADPVSAIGLVGPDLAYAMPLLDHVPGAAERLPPLADPMSIAGPVRAGPFAGVPVVTGTMDAWTALFGVGAAAEGDAVYLAGTSEVLGLVSSRRGRGSGVVTFPTWAGITYHAAPTQSGGASLAWLGRLLGRDAGELAAMAAPIRPESPLFLPHLAGERAPLWDPVSRGGFAGLDAATGPAELAAAVMEGVAFSARLALEALETSGGRRADRLLGGGGGLTSDAWCRIRADALGRRIDRMHGPDADPGATGAAILAGVGMGLMPSLATAARRFARVDASFEPDPRRAAVAERRYALYRPLYDGLRPIAARLAR